MLRDDHAHADGAPHLRRCTPALELAEILVDYRKAGIENMLALGGDPPDRPPTAARASSPTRVELVELAARDRRFSVGVAAHPELPSALARPRDRPRTWPRKLRSADFAITQFFFEAEDYLGLIDDLAALGSTSRWCPGIMPVTNLARSQRMAEMSGAAVPAEVVDRLEAAAATSRTTCAASASRSPPSCARAAGRGRPGPALLHAQPLAPRPREIYANLGLASG